MAAKQTDSPRGLTREELLALPAAVDLETANRALSLSRTTGYALAKRGRYPCAVLRVGNAYRVVTADLLKLLQIDAEAPPRVEVGLGGTGGGRGPFLSGPLLLLCLSLRSSLRAAGVMGSERSPLCAAVSVGPRQPVPAWC